jgi:putative transposase
MVIDRPNQVWATDITYIRIRHGFLYLCAIMDWATRKVLAWRPSNTLTSDFCTAALKEAIARYGPPITFNTDQGSQFTRAEFTDVLKEHGIRISMDGRGRCHDNIFVERLRWAINHECVYLHPCGTGIKQKRSIAECFDWYNRQRPHQSPGWETPDETYFDALAKAQPLAA